MLNLRESQSLPQNIIQRITSGLKSLIELIHELLKIRTKNSSIKYQRTVTTSATDDSILLTDLNQVFSTITGAPTEKFWKKPRSSQQKPWFHRNFLTHSVFPWMKSNRMCTDEGSVERCCLHQILSESFALNTSDANDVCEYVELLWHSHQARRRASLYRGFCGIQHTHE